MERRCKDKNKEGGPCQMPPLEDADYCWAHDPENAASRAEARRLGGQRRQTPKGGDGDGPYPEYRSVEAIQQLLERTVADTLLQENSDRRSRTVATLSQVMLKTLEVGEHEERLKALEAVLADKKSRKVA